jgi:hypothetical protein
MKINKTDKTNKAKKKFNMPKMTKETIIYAIIIIAIALYIGITIFKKPTDDTPQNDQINNEDNTNIEDLLDPKPETNTESATIDTSQKLPYDESIKETEKDTDSSYKYPEDGNIYLNDFNNISTCRVYIPAGYTYTEQWTGSLLLKPDDIDLNVEGNAPILLTWFNIRYMDNLHNGDITFEDEYSQYTVLDKYEYAYDQSNTTNVYVIQIDTTNVIHETDPENPENIISENVTDTSYRVIVDYNLDGTLYPMFSINSENMHCVINNRYPDILSVAKAIFKPL